MHLPSEYASDLHYNAKGDRVAVVFDTAQAREDDVFLLAPSTWGGLGVQSNAMDTRLKDIDRELMARGGARDRLRVNAPGRTVERIHQFRPSCLVTNVTPSTSADPSREPYVDSALNDAYAMRGARAL